MAGIVYLVKRDEKWDIIEVAAVEISLVFFFITIVLGSIWARPIWNTWWTWDPRLTTAAVTELIYIAYSMLRQGIEDPVMRARFGAVYTIIGALSAPITFFAIRLFRTIHPVVIGSGDPSAQGTFAMSPPMLLAFFLRYSPSLLCSSTCSGTGSGSAGWRTTSKNSSSTSYVRSQDAFR